MTEQEESTQTKKSMAPKLILSGVVVAVIIALAAWQLGEEKSPESEEIVLEESSQDEVMEGEDEAMEESGEDAEMIDQAEDQEEEGDLAYEDGEFTATGGYTSPAGAEEVVVTLTLEDGVVTAATFEGKAEHPTSVIMQGKFAEGFEEEVLNKSIDEIALTVVNGSSLTPKGFMDALEQIKEEAAI